MTFSSFASELIISDFTTSSGNPELIIDFNDLGLELNYGVTSIVNYVPYKNGPVAGAGIQ